MAFHTTIHNNLLNCLLTLTDSVWIQLYVAHKKVEREREREREERVWIPEFVASTAVLGCIRLRIYACIYIYKYVLLFV